MAMVETNGGKTTARFFRTDKQLLDNIAALTEGGGGKYLCRDFVAPLLDFCLDGCYNGKVGLVCGLRATGKTVGLLQAAEALALRGFKPAYARFNYDDAGAGAVTAEIEQLAKEGYTHFFLDEASYLGGFMNISAEWADSLTPSNRVKLIISGTDNFMLWLAKNGPLVHRYADFSTNYMSFPEYKRVFGGTFADYKTSGGVIIADSMPNFIQYAVVDNLLHTIDHCVDDANRTNYYTDRLYGIDSAVIFKAVISILKCAVAPFITRHFVKNARTKNLPDLGDAISRWSSADKRDIKARIADALRVYDDFAPLKNPGAIIETLIEFLVRIGCLIESFEAMSDFGGKEKMFYFSHNALMNYAVRETMDTMPLIDGVARADFIAVIKQAAEGYINESIVFTHVLTCAAAGDAVFKYRDSEDREIDIVSVNRETKVVRLMEVKSKDGINEQDALTNEARHLLDETVLDNIGVDGSFAITRALIYQGDSRIVSKDGKELLLVNAEEFISRDGNLSAFLDAISKSGQNIAPERSDGYNSVLGGIKKGKEEQAEYLRKRAADPTRANKRIKRKDDRAR